MPATDRTARAVVGVDAHPGSNRVIAWLADIPSSALVVVPLVVLGAYTVFGATGFGSSVINVPTIAHWFPLSFTVPLVTAVDFVATANATFRQWRGADLAEIRRLLPTMALGIAAGATLLIKLPAWIALLALAVFIVAYGVYLLVGPRALPRVGPRWAWPIGFFGGIFSVLFGTGGPIYVVYLSARVHDKTALRATMSTLVAIAVVIRTTVFVVTGLLLDARIIALGAMILPFMLCGYWLGNRLHFALSREGLLKVIAILLLANGALLIDRALALVHAGA